MWALLVMMFAALVGKAEAWETCGQDVIEPATENLCDVSCPVGQCCPPSVYDCSDPANGSRSCCSFGAGYGMTINWCSCGAPPEQREYCVPGTNNLVLSMTCENFECGCSGLFCLGGPSVSTWSVTIPGDEIFQIFPIIATMSSGGQEVLDDEYLTSGGYPATFTENADQLDFCWDDYQVPDPQNLDYTPSNPYVLVDFGFAVSGHYALDYCIQMVGGGGAIGIGSTLATTYETEPRYSVSDQIQLMTTTCEGSTSLSRGDCWMMGRYVDVFDRFMYEDEREMPCCDNWLNGFNPIGDDLVGSDLDNMCVLINAVNQYKWSVSDCDARYITAAVCMNPFYVQCAIDDDCSQAPPGGECYKYVCEANVCSQVPKDACTVCGGSASSSVCNGDGACVECATTLFSCECCEDADCTDGVCSPEKTCVECNDPGDCGPLGGDTSCFEGYTCDSHLCTPNYKGHGVVCRDVAGICDVAEECTGSSPECPDNGFQPAGTECRPAVDVCDEAELCTGASPLCPNDEVTPAGTECRAVVDVCDAAEECDGINTACPIDGYKSSNVECRGSAGPCDVAEMCTGSSPSCPDDGFQPANFICRTVAGPCDEAEMCTGSSAVCPDDSYKPVDTICRAAADLCDAAEVCNGSSPECPDDGFQPADTVCREAVGLCDVAEKCDGLSMMCPGDALVSAGTECRAAADVCDEAELCTGASPMCPNDEVKPAGTECRAVADVCDVAEECDGINTACPMDGYKSASAECRGSAGPCDVAEMCTGSSASCPNDVYKAAGVACQVATQVCQEDAVCTGTAISCPAHPYKPEGTPCGPIPVGCDFQDYCTGDDYDCPEVNNYIAGGYMYKCGSKLYLCGVTETELIEVAKGGKKGKKKGHKGKTKVAYATDDEGTCILGAVADVEEMEYGGHIPGQGLAVGCAEVLGNDPFTPLGPNDVCANGKKIKNFAALQCVETGDGGHEWLCCGKCKKRGGGFDCDMTDYGDPASNIYVDSCPGAIGTRRQLLQLRRSDG